MANIVTFPCEYLVFSSGYDERLIEPEHIPAFQQFCSSIGVIPVGVYQDHYNGHPNINIIPVRNGQIALNEIPTEEEQRIATNLNQIITQSNLARRGCIIFRVGSFENATKVFLSMKNLDYCGMYDLMDIKFLSNDKGMIDIVFVSVDAESG